MRTETGKRYRERNRSHDSCTLPENNAADTQHPESVRTPGSLRKCLRLCVNGSNHAQKARTPVKVQPNRLLQLNARSLQIPMTWNAEAVENHPCGVRPVERVEMNTGNIISNKIMALFQRVFNASAPDH